MRKQIGIVALFPLEGGHQVDTFRKVNQGIVKSGRAGQGLHVSGNALFIKKINHVNTDSL